MASILVMEDDAEAALALRDILERHGHDVQWFRTGSDAVAALEQGHFDVAITDIYVHQNGRVINDGGIALIGKMRARQLQAGPGAHAIPPIIAISGAASLPGNPFVLNIAQSVGADYALAKPIDEEDLLEVLSKALGGGQSV